MIKTAILLTAVLCCKLCFAEKYVTIMAIYQLDKPIPETPEIYEFHYHLNINVVGLADDATLLDAMTKAQQENKMMFDGIQSTDETFGLWVTTIGYLHASGKQYWKIQAAVGDADFADAAFVENEISVGVSNYVPVNTEKVLFTWVSFEEPPPGYVDDSIEGDSADTNAGTSGGSVANLGFRLFLITLLASLILMQH